MSKTKKMWVKTIIQSVIFGSAAVIGICLLIEWFRNGGAQVIGL